jgi:hypothetical protein
VLGQPRAEAALAVAPGAGVLRAEDGRHRAVPEAGDLGGQPARAGHVVDHAGVGADVVDLAVEQDEGEATGGEQARQRGAQRGGGEHHAVERAVEQALGPVELGALGGEHDQAQAGALDGGVQAVHEVEVERVAQVADHHADLARAAGDQAAAPVAGDVAQVARRGHHAPAGGLRDARIVAQGARDGGLRDAGRQRHIVAGGRALARTSRHTYSW